MEPTDLPEWAEQLAASYLANSGDRWRHVQAVGQAARDIAHVLPEYERPWLIAAAPVAGRPWQQRRSVRAAYVLILLVLAACAFTDSFVALAELAQVTGALPGARAFTLPLMLDGLTLAGRCSPSPGSVQGSPAYGYALIALGTLASLARNVAHAPPSVPARIIAGAPPLILFLTFEAAAISFRRRPASAIAATPAHAGALPEETGPGRVPASGGTAPRHSGATP